MRRQKQKQPPVTLKVFEKLLLQAIEHYNRCTKKHRLRTVPMRDAGVNVTPLAIFEYTQSQRRGDGARALQPYEVYNRFIPWHKRVCQLGLVEFNKHRYTSGELVDYFNEHVKAPGRRKCNVEVRRLDGPANVLLWRHSDGAISQLRLTEEDERNIGGATWTELDLMNADDLAREVQLRPKRGRSRARLTAEQDGLVASAEQNRLDHFGGILGSSATAAKQNAQRVRDQMHVSDQAQAYGFPQEIAVAASVAKVTPRGTTASEEDYFRSLGL